MARCVDHGWPFAGSCVAIRAEGSGYDPVPEREPHDEG